MHSMNIKKNLFIYNIIEIEQYPFKPHRKKGLKSECLYPKGESPSQNSEALAIAPQAVSMASTWLNQLMFLIDCQL